ncbi:hypothetical protein WMF30_32245 [Sorangium sp. So ce134]
MTVGQKDGPALLPLHGGFGDMDDSTMLLPGWTRRFGVVGDDSRGHVHRRAEAPHRHRRLFASAAPSLARFSIGARPPRSCRVAGRSTENLTTLNRFGSLRAYRAPQPASRAADLDNRA